MADGKPTIEVKDLFHLVHYEYGEPYFGSCAGMRFRVARNPMEMVALKAPDEKGEAKLSFTVWPEPDSYAATPDDLKTTKEFPFSDEGLQQGTDWLNEMLPGFRKD